METPESVPSELFSDDSREAAMDWHYLQKLPSFLSDAQKVIQFLDLGAGNGASRGKAYRFLGEERVNWTGVDIGDSSEHLNRPKSAPPIDVYDGVKLPYENETFDVVWCRQVLEHVRYPDAVISEVSRVLCPGGLFLGSVSQLEPFHSRSIFNWTHYGIRVVFGDHGLEVFELAPGVDGILLGMRAVFGYDTGLNAFFSKETPVNTLLEALLERRLDATESNKIRAIKREKLKLAGHIHFAAKKRLG